MRRTLGVIVACAIALTANLPGQEAKTKEEDPAHNELRALRDEVRADINKGNLDGAMKHVHPNAVFTPMDSKVCHGVAEIRAYLDRMLTGPNRVVQEFKSELPVDELSALYGGDTAVAWGSSRDQFKLTGGLQFESVDRWSCTLVKENGVWLIANLHSSTNLFDNPILAGAKKTALIAGAVAAIAGLLIGIIAGRMSKRKSAPVQGAVA